MRINKSDSILNIKTNIFFYSKKYVYNNRKFLVGHYMAILLKNFINNFLYGFLIKPYKLYGFIKSHLLHLCLYFLKNSLMFQFTTLSDICVVDYPQRFNHRFMVTYVLLSTLLNIRFFLCLFINSFVPIISIGRFFSSSNWLEREIWDMFGIKFLLHKDLRRILNDYGFHGYPLRKDFPLIGYIELRYDDLLQSVCIELVEITQSFRFFRFENPWLNWR